MKQFNNIIFKYFFLIILPVFFMTEIVLKAPEKGAFFTVKSVNRFATIYLMSVGIAYFTMFLVRRAQKLSHNKLVKFIPIGFLIFAAGSYIIANVTVALGVFISYKIKGLDMSNFIYNLFHYKISHSSMLLFYWLIFFALLFFFVLWKKSADKEIKLREEKLKYQYRNLKSHINPHFLFNSFNALSELVYEAPKDADKYIQQLSKIYRYIIENEEMELISLDKEIDFVQQYFELQQLRNQEKIELNIDIPSPENYKVIPVSVQSLVENAIKHNSANYDSPLHINIIIEDDNIVVKNNLQKKSTLELSTQTGLENLKQQSKLILNKEVEIIDSENEFKVKLPYAI